MEVTTYTEERNCRKKYGRQQCFPYFGQFGQWNMIMFEDEKLDKKKKKKTQNIVSSL